MSVLNIIELNKYFASLDYGYAFKTMGVLFR